MKKSILYLYAVSSVIVFSVFMLAVIIFAAGTWSYVQGWAYWIIFTAATFIITVYFMIHDPALIERRLNPKETLPSQIIGQCFAFVLFFGGLIVVSCLDHRYGLSLMPAWFNWTADIIVVLGFIIVFFVFKHNPYSSKAVEHMDGQKVITDGPYQYVRHPMYSGALLVIVFTPLALDSYLGMIAACILAGIVVARIGVEEKLLNRELEGYQEYCKKQQYRLIPHIW